MIIRFGQSFTPEIHFILFYNWNVLKIKKEMWKEVSDGGSEMNAFHSIISNFLSVGHTEVDVSWG